MLPNRVSLVAVLVLALALAIPSLSAGPLAEAALSASYEQRQPMPLGRYGLRAAAAGGKLYAIGGETGTCSPTNANQQFDPGTNSWLARAPIPTARINFAITEWNGKIYTAGGDGPNICSGVSSSRFDIFDPATNTWSQGQDIPQTLDSAGLAPLNGKLYLIGGMENYPVTQARSAVQVYDPGTNAWNTHPQVVPQPGPGAAVTYGGSIYFVTFVRLDSGPQAGRVFVFDGTNWNPNPVVQLPNRGGDASYDLAVMGARIVALETRHGYSPRLHVIDPTALTFETIETATGGWFEAGRSLGFAAIGDAAYALGGWRSSGQYSNLNERVTLADVPPPAPDPGACPQEWTPDASTAGLWHFNETGGAIAADSSANGNSGSVSGGAAFVPGAFGNALRFDGVNDHVTMGNQPSLNVGTGDFAIEACIRTTSGPSNFIASKGVGWTGAGYHISVVNNKAYCLVRDYHPSGAHAPGHELPILGTSVVTDGQWHHIKCGRTGQRVSLQVDGVEQGFATFAADVGTIDNGGQFRVGTWLREDNVLVAFFNGDIDEVRLTKPAPAPPVACPPQIAGGPDDRGLWHFAEGADALVNDSSGNGSHGSISGARWADATCLEFDGVDDYVEIADASTLDGMMSLEVEAWVYPRSYPTDHNGDGIVNKWGPGFVADDSYRLNLDSSGRAHFAVSDGRTDEQGGRTEVSSLEPIAPNAWTHLRGVYRVGGSAEIYVNGELAGSVLATTTVIQNTAQPVWIGRSQADTGDGFDGFIDEVRVGVLPNQPPVISTVTNDGPIGEGSSATITVTASDPDPSDTLAYEFDCDGNLAYEVGPQPSNVVSCPFDDNAGSPFPVNVRVTDAHGGEATDSTTIVVANVAPAVRDVTVSPSPSDEGQAVTASASFADPGAGDGPFTCTVDYGAGPVDGVVVGDTCTGPSHTYGDNGLSAVTIAVTDKDGGTGEDSADHVVANVVPSVGAVVVSPSPSDEGQTVTASASFSDPGASDGPFTCTVDYGAGPVDGTIDGDTCTGPPHTYGDNGLSAVTIAVTDKDGGTGSNSTTHVVNNVAPVAAILAPASGALFAVGTPATFGGSFTDEGTADTHTCEWLLDATAVAGTVAETAGSGTCEATHTFTAAGIYRVKLTVTDDDGASSVATTVGDLLAFVVVYDPDGGFVTGGGWIQSPAGAYAADPGLAGKATFGFNSKYQKGASVPTGQTEFHFQVASFNFHSAAYDWLVVAGARAQFKGVGMVNGAGDYGFMLTGIDGQVAGGGGVDRFRIKIWDRATGGVIYDNQVGADDDAEPSTALGGGSIVIHK